MASKKTIKKVTAENANRVLCEACIDLAVDIASELQVEEFSRYDLLVYLQVALTDQIRREGFEQCKTMRYEPGMTSFARKEEDYLSERRQELLEEYKAAKE